MNKESYKAVMFKDCKTTHFVHTECQKKNLSTIAGNKFQCSTCFQNYGEEKGRWFQDSTIEWTYVPMEVRDYQQFIQMTLFFPKKQGYDNHRITGWIPVSSSGLKTMYIICKMFEKGVLMTVNGGQVQCNYKINYQFISQLDSWSNPEQDGYL